MSVDYVWLPAPTKGSLCDGCAFNNGHEDCMERLREPKFGHIVPYCSIPNVIAIAREDAPEYIAKLTAEKMGVQK